MKQSIYIIGGIIIALVILQTIDTAPNMSVAEPDTCFSIDDCKVAINEGFCDVEFDCILGKCAERQIPCPAPEEKCYTGKDEDNDGKIGCKDEDCYQSIYCPCSMASYVLCQPGKCYCGTGTDADWIEYGGTFYCQCR